ncbi:MAG: flagellar basal body P-ring formation chaperone FlgA [Armatimonadetes bacterium]|nr:flagellar basal body P-ring formation chaperone FlgA [Armatimonadota bacterium]
MSKQITKYVLILGLMLAIVPAIATPQLTIQVRPSCEVESQTITLGDIATIKVDDQAFAEKAKKTVICCSPLPGKSRELTRSQITTALRRVGLWSNSIVFLCPDLVSIKRRALLVTGEMLFDAVREYVSKKEDLPGVASAEIVRLPTDQEVPIGKLELRVKSSNKQLKGRVNVPIEIVIDGRTYRTVYVPALIKVIAQVPVATKTIAKDEELDASNISLEERDITNLPNDIIIGKPEAGWSACVPIPQGSVLRRGWIASPPVIKSGDAVIVFVNNGAVSVSDKGVAVQEGRIGDRIKVRLFRDSQEVRGTVTAPGIIEISLDRRT